MSKILKCEILCEEMKKRYGKFINLELTRARRLEGTGKVKILDPIDKKAAIAEDYSKKILVCDPNNPSAYFLKNNFTLKKKYKIAWLQDYSKPDGGAELSNKYLVSIGERLGFDIVGVTPSNFSYNILKNSDLVIVNNFFEFTIDQQRTVYKLIYENRKPYVKYDHDLREFKRLDKSSQLFLQSEAVVFISPMHRKIAENLLGKNKHFYTFPLAIDTDLYKVNPELKRKSATVLVPSYKKCVGEITTYIKNNTHQNFTAITGRNNLTVADANVKCFISKSFLEMVDLYNTHEYMYHRPTSPWAGDRVYFEALLCGCKPIVNENVGHVSWNVDESDPEKIRSFLNKAPFDFWKLIDRLIDNLKERGVTNG